MVSTPQLATPLEGVVASDRRGEARSRIAKGALRTLLILQLVYVFNFVDRQIVGILATSIKADLHLSDTELGLLGGFAFAILYTGLGLPIAWLADRRSRVRIVTISLLCWSVFTALCGFAQSFICLFLCRVLVGIGEAGGVAPSYSIVSDSFPRRQRGRAMGLLLIGIPLGSATGIFLGGLIAHWVSWRVAFVAVGVAGVVLVPLVGLGVPEPVRGQFDGGLPGTKPSSFRETMGFLVRRPSFWVLSLATASASIMHYGAQFWLPTVFQRSYGLSLQATAIYYGSIVLVGGGSGVALSGRLSDLLAPRSPGAYAVVPALSCLLCVPLYATAIFSRSLIVAWPLLALAQGLASASIAPTIVAIHNISFPSMRTTATAFYQLINNLIGLSVGSALIGLISDELTRRIGADALRWSIVAGLAFYLMAAALYFLASRYLVSDSVGNDAR
jgi:MFS family permease